MLTWDIIHLIVIGLNLAARPCCKPRKHCAEAVLAEHPTEGCGARLALVSLPGHARKRRALYHTALFNTRTIAAPSNEGPALRYNGRCARLRSRPPRRPPDPVRNRQEPSGKEAPRIRQRAQSKSRRTHPTYRDASRVQWQYRLRAKRNSRACALPGPWPPRFWR